MKSDTIFQLVKKITGSQQKIIDLINREYSNLKSKRSSYSLRQFAKKIHIQTPALSEILSGKRKLTSRAAKNILNGLSIPENEIIDLVSPIEKDESNAKSKKKKIFNTAKILNENLSLSRKELLQEEFKIISDWWYFAILSLSELKGTLYNAKWIAQRIGITETQASNALDTLLKMNMIKKNHNFLESTGSFFETTAQIADEAVQKNHQQGLKLAEKSLLQDPVDLREFDAVTLSINSERMAEAKELIYSFRNQICKLLSEGSKTDVYRLQVQLFPIISR